MVKLEKQKEFHEAFKQPICKECKFPAMGRRMLRMSMLKEEFIEYLDAEGTSNMVEVADALADMVVIIYGTAIEYGIPLDMVYDEVHRSNMSKLDGDGKPIYREDGKVAKGPNYQPPNIKAILEGVDIE